VSRIGGKTESNISEIDSEEIIKYVITYVFYAWNMHNEDSRFPYILLFKHMKIISSMYKF
jgi:hypothetical protein